MRFLFAALAWLLTLAFGVAALVACARVDAPIAIMLPLLLLVGTLPVVAGSLVLVTTSKRT